MLKNSNAFRVNKITKNPVVIPSIRSFNVQTNFNVQTKIFSHSAILAKPFSIAKYTTSTQQANKVALSKNFSFTALPQPITKFQPSLFTPSYVTLFNKQQQRKASNFPQFARTTDQDSSMAYLIAAIAAIALGTLLYYAFTVEGSVATDTSQRLRQSLLYLCAGLGITAASAKYFFNSNIYYSLARMNPWASLAITFGGTLAAMIATQAIPYENTIPKHISYLAFNSMIGLSLCPLVALGGPILMKAAFTTGCVVSALGLTAAASPEGTFLSWGGPLSIGLGVVFASSIGSIVFPASSLLYNVCLYGGAGVFGLFVLYDVDKMKTNAKYSRHYDPINNSIGLYMDIINLFVRIAQMYASSNNRK